MKILSRLDAFSSYSPVLLRLILGVVMTYHGYQKIIGDMSKFAGFVAKIGFPFASFFAYSAALAEFAGGIALILGLLTRWSAFFVACTMAVAVFLVHFKDGMFGEHGYEYPLTLLVAALSLMLTGGGPVSIDRNLIKREF